MALAASGAVHPPPAAVTTTVVHAASWQPTLRAIGSLEAVQGVTVSADLPGIVKEIASRAATVQAGRHPRAARHRPGTGPARSQHRPSATWRCLNLKRAARPAREERQFAERLRHRRGQRTPGRGQRRQRQRRHRPQNDPRALQRPARHPPRQPRAIPQQRRPGRRAPVDGPDLRQLHPAPAEPARLRRGRGGARCARTRRASTVFKGKINAINSLVDSATRNFQAQATLANPEGKLRPGMFANVDVLLGGERDVLPVPGSAIAYAPYGNSVYVIAHNIKVPKDPDDPTRRTKTLDIGGAPAVRQDRPDEGRPRGGHSPG